MRNLCGAFLALLFYKKSLYIEYRSHSERVLAPLFPFLFVKVEVLYWKRQKSKRQRKTSGCLSSIESQWKVSKSKELLLKLRGIKFFLQTFDLKDNLMKIRQNSE